MKFFPLMGRCSLSILSLSCISFLANSRVPAAFAQAAFAQAAFAQAAFEEVEAEIQAEAIAQSSPSAFELPMSPSLETWAAPISEPIPEPQPISQIAPDSSGSVGNTFSPERVQQLRQDLLIQPLVFSAPRAASPGSSLGSPSAYGASAGQAFAAVSYASQARNDSKADGSSIMGLGFGNPVDNLGIEVDVAIISLADAFADAGAVGVKVHKVFPEVGNLGVAAGWSNALKWGDAQSAKDTFYGVATKRFRLRPQQDNPLPLTLSAGVGTGGFRSKGAINANTNDPNVFASAGLQVIPELSLISNWTGSQLNLGVSATPFRQLPVVFSLGASDVTRNSNGGTRLLFNVGYSYRF